jgi:large subunit ribosomal protein L5
MDLQKTYQKEILPQLSKELGGLNIFQTPALEKIVVNVGVGKIATARRQKSVAVQTDEEMLKDIIDGVAIITGQKPSLVLSKKSIAGFKLREGLPVGLRVTLRRQKMYDFLARLIHIALPRTRDFRGLNFKSVDKSGNLTIGIPENIIFPEAPATNFIWGLEVTLVTNTEDKEQAIELFKKLGLPLK